MRSHAHAYTSYSLALPIHWSQVLYELYYIDWISRKWWFRFMYLCVHLNPFTPLKSIWIPSTASTECSVPHHLCVGVFKSKQLRFWIALLIPNEMRERKSIQYEIAKIEFHTCVFEIHWFGIDVAHSAL